MITEVSKHRLCNTFKKFCRKYSRLFHSFNP